MMKTLILILLLTSSCVSNRPFIAPKERCSVSFKFKKCTCYLYDLMTVKRIGNPVDHALEKCDDITGFHAEDWAKSITPWGRENVQVYNDWRD